MRVSFFLMADGLACAAAVSWFWPGDRLLYKRCLAELRLHFLEDKCLTWLKQMHRMSWQYLHQRFLVRNLP